MKYLINNITTDWKEFINHEFEKQYMKDIDNFLFNSNEVIYPERQNIFRAFNYFNIEQTKIVIFGQDPYFNPNQANGLCFSVNKTTISPPSLKNIFKKLLLDKQINRTNPDLSDWATQGFLLLNSCLTVFKDKPNSHKHLKWNIFLDNVIERLNNNQNPILFLCLGNQAKKYIKKINQNNHKILTWTHPSPLAATRCGFFKGNLFNEIDKFMINNYKRGVKW